jgi:hypothetical protein
VNVIRRWRRRSAVAAALSCTAALALGAPSGADVAEARTTITVPKVVTPGRTVTLRATGFAAGAAVRVQWGVYTQPPANCCVSTVVPPDSRPGFQLDSTGAGVLRVRVPRAYARCVSAICRNPNWARFKRGQRIYVFVFTDDFGSTGAPDTAAKALSRIRH